MPLRGPQLGAVGRDARLRVPCLASGSAHPPTPDDQLTSHTVTRNPVADHENGETSDTRNRDGLVSFCFWWANGQWYRGATDTSGELSGPIPPLQTLDETVRAMTSQTGPGTANQCNSLLTAATKHNATPADVAAIFTTKSDADVDTATNQLSLAGLLAT